MFVQYVKNIKPKLLYSGTECKEEMVSIVESFIISSNRKDNTIAGGKPSSSKADNTHKHNIYFGGRAWAVMCAFPKKVLDEWLIAGETSCKESIFS